MTAALEFHDVRSLVAADRRRLVDPAIKAACGLRWRDLFMTNAAADEAALSEAGARMRLPGIGLSVPTGPDRRPERQRIAERYLRDAGEEWIPVPGAPAASPGDYTVVFCPGLIGSLMPVRGLASALPELERQGWRVLVADSHPMRSCEANVGDIAAAVERGEGLTSRHVHITRADAEPPGDVVLVGYSKGAADALTFLIERPDLAPRVKALVCWAGAVGGSYLADDIYGAIADASQPVASVTSLLTTTLGAIFPPIHPGEHIQQFEEYDVLGAIRDLTTAERERFLEEHGATIDALDIPIFNLTAATTATQVPTFQIQGYLQIRGRQPGGDADNDMQLTQAQARMTTPMATDLAVLSAHHWDVAYDAFPLPMRMGSANLDHKFPRTAALTATCQLVDELGLVAQ